jgi:hypothetical protein
MHWLSFFYLLLRLLHVSAFICHLQGAFCILMSYLKGRNGCVVVMYCKCWWPVCTGCCGLVCYVVQLSAYWVVRSAGWVGARAGLDKCRKPRPTGIRSSDRPARSQSLYLLSYPAHINLNSVSIYRSISGRIHFNLSYSVFRVHHLLRWDRVFRNVNT